MNARPTVSTCSSTMSISILASSSPAKTLGPSEKEAGRDQLLVGRRLVSRRGEKIASELLAEELGERLILIERVHDIVAIPPRVAVGDVFVQAVGIRVSRHIEPVPAPPFAVVRRSEQAVHHPENASGESSARKASISSGEGATRSGQRSPGGSRSACRPVRQVPALWPRAWRGRSGRAWSVARLRSEPVGQGDRPGFETPRTSALTRCRIHPWLRWGFTRTRVGGPMATHWVSNATSDADSFLWEAS